MNTTTATIRHIALAAAAAASLLGAIPAAEARPGPGARSGGHGAYHGVAYRGGYHGGHWGGRGYYGRPGGYWGGRYGYWGPGVFWGGVGLGLGVAALATYPYAYAEPAYVYDTPVYREREIVEVPAPSGPRSGPRPGPSAGPAPDPIFYPRDGQSDARKESDRQECNRWATTQPNAMADASVFQRATLACMDGRGYTAR